MKSNNKGEIVCEKANKNIYVYLLTQPSLRIFIHIGYIGCF